MMLAILGLLLALASPLLLLPIEQFLPHPHIIEEAVKLAIVVMIIKSEPPPGWHAVTPRTVVSGNKWPYIFLAGFLFAVSESILYLTNIFSIGNLMLFPKRLLLTGILHTSTVVLMYFSGRKSYLGLVVGFVGAILVHYLFNLWVLNL